MAKYLKSNPDFKPWTEQDQENYLIQARDKYVQKRGQPWVEPPHWRWTWRKDPDYRPEPTPKVDRDLIGHLYDEGRILGLLRLCYREFQAFILCDPRYPGRYTRGKKKGHGWLRPDGTYETKGSSRYRKPPVAKIAESSEKCDISRLRQQKQAWRAEKGFDRDHRKSRWKRSCPASYRKITAHDRRAAERRMIYKEDWDSYLTEKNCDFIDRWMWD